MSSDVCYSRSLPDVPSASGLGAVGMGRAAALQWLQSSSFPPSRVTQEQWLRALWLPHGAQTLLTSYFGLLVPWPFSAWSFSLQCHFLPWGADRNACGELVFHWYQACLWAHRPGARSPLPAAQLGPEVAQNTFFSLSSKGKAQTGLKFNSVLLGNCP